MCGALALVGVAEWAQASFTFAGDHRLMWFHQDFPALYAAAEGPRILRRVGSPSARRACSVTSTHPSSLR